MKTRTTSSVTTRARRVAYFVALPFALAACGSDGTAVEAAAPETSAVSTAAAEPAGASGGGAPTSTEPAGTEPASTETGAPMTISVSPESGAKAVGPEARITITGKNGALDSVDVVDSDGRVLDGEYDSDRTSWKATDPVRYDTNYKVRAVGAGQDGKSVVKTATFSTGNEPNGGTLNVATVFPEDGSTVGVATPIAIGFDRPVQNKRAVQDALEVTTSPKVAGAWYWIDDQYVDYRPEKFWPAGTKVTMKAKLEGVGAGNGVSGAGTRTVSFTVGREQIMKVDVDKHRLYVVRGGKTVKTFQVSTGKKGWETRNGIKVLMDKETSKRWTNEEIDAKEEYTYKSKYAMRMTNSGEFVHDAPWNKGNIGENNSSHGCVGLNPEAMEWLWKNSIIGDPIVVSGSPKPYKDLINRYADWNIPWAKWKAGNSGRPNA